MNLLEQVRACQVVHVIHPLQQKALDRYQQAMGDSVLPTQVIAKRLGCSPKTAVKFLRILEERGKVAQVGCCLGDAGKTMLKWRWL